MTRGRPSYVGLDDGGGEKRNVPETVSAVGRSPPVGCVAAGVGVALSPDVGATPAACCGRCCVAGVAADRLSRLALAVTSVVPSAVAAVASSAVVPAGTAVVALDAASDITACVTSGEAPAAVCAVAAFVALSDGVAAS